MKEEEKKKVWGVERRRKGKRQANKKPTKNEKKEGNGKQCKRKKGKNGKMLRKKANYQKSLEKISNERNVNPKKLN